MSLWELSPQLRHVVVKGRLFDVEGFPDASSAALDGERAVFGKGDILRDAPENDRVIGGADHFHVHLLHDGAEKLSCASSSLIDSRIHGEDASTEKAICQ